MTTPTLPPLPDKERRCAMYQHMCAWSEADPGEEALGCFDAFDAATDALLTTYGQACADAARADLLAELERLREGWLAACAFIDSHAADPDITAEMVSTYAEFTEARAAIDSANQGESK